MIPLRYLQEGSLHDLIKTPALLYIPWFPWHVLSLMGTEKWTKAWIQKLPFQQLRGIAFARIPKMNYSNFSKSSSFQYQYFSNSSLIYPQYLSLFCHLFWIGFRSYWPSISFLMPSATSTLWLLLLHLFRPWTCE